MFPNTIFAVFVLVNFCVVVDAAVIPCTCDGRSTRVGSQRSGTVDKHEKQRFNNGFCDFNVGGEESAVSIGGELDETRPSGALLQCGTETVDGFGKLDIGCGALVDGLGGALGKGLGVGPVDAVSNVITSFRSSGVVKRPTTSSSPNRGDDDDELGRVSAKRVGRDVPMLSSISPAPPVFVDFSIHDLGNITDYPVCVVLRVGTVVGGDLLQVNNNTASATYVSLSSNNTVISYSSASAPVSSRIFRAAWSTS